MTHLFGPNMLNPMTLTHRVKTKHREFEIKMAFGAEHAIIWVPELPGKTWYEPLTVQLLDQVRAYCDLHASSETGMTTTEEYRGTPENAVGNAVQRNTDVHPK